MASVAIRDVRKAFGATAVIHGVDISIRDGEFVVLVGPSGCGKSTLLRMIAGLENITNGEIRIGERVVNNLPPKERDVAMVFQNYALYPHMTVAADFITKGIRCNAICPGTIVSPSFEDRVKAVSQTTGKPLKQVRENFIDRQPMARLGTAEEVAALALFLASDESSYITGQPHLVDGGLAL
jgi:ABC-type sugar transport system ATPase subunit